MAYSSCSSVLGYCLSLIVSLGMQEPWRAERVMTSSTEAAPTISSTRAHRDTGGDDYSYRLFVDGYHSKVEFSFSRTLGHHGRNIRGQVPWATGENQNGR